MKNIFNLCKVLCIIALIWIVTSCKQESKIAAVAAIANLQCPLVQDDVTIEKITYNADENTLEYHSVMTSSDDKFEIFTLNNDLIKSIIVSLISNGGEETNKLVDDLISEKASIKYIYYNSDKSNKAEATLTTDEMIQLKNAPTTNSAENIIENFVKVQNAQMPQEIDDITTATSVAYTDTSFVYNYDVKISDDKLKELDTELLKTNIAKSLSSSISILAKLCIETNRYLIYAYDVNDKSSHFEIVFTPEELNAAIQE